MSANKYALRFPFRLPEGRPLSPLDEPVEMACRELSVKLSKQSADYLLTISAFPTEDSAAAFISRVYAGLAWALLQYDLPAAFDIDPQGVEYFEDPESVAKRLFGEGNSEVGRVDAVIDGRRPAIMLMDKKVSAATAGCGSIIAGVNASTALYAITEGAAFPRAEVIVQDGKLKTALDLYNTHFQENSQSARFLTLTIALEALMPDEKKAPYVVDMIERWLEDIRTRKGALEPTSDEWASYDALEKEIGFRREVSIRKKIRALVQRTLWNKGPDVATNVAAKAVKLYDKRSRLIHKGYLPELELQAATAEMKEIVRSVLKSKLVEATSGAV